jgi:hypothetical protein
MRAGAGSLRGLWHHGASQTTERELSSFMPNAMPSTLRLASIDAGSPSPAVA